MRVGQDRIGTSTTPVDESASAGQRSPRARTAERPPNSDHFTPSSDVRVLQAAIEQAAVGPAVREDVVTRMRGLLDRGEIGQDPMRIADAIIDRNVLP